MKQSSGTLLYRGAGDGLEVLLVHPSGWYNKGKPWGIPKGIPDEDEETEAAARRETEEECGLIAGELTYLGAIEYQKSKKQVHCFAGPAPDAEPRCCSWEIDEARFISLEQARQLIHPDQRVFLDLLVQHLSSGSTHRGG